MQRPAEMTWSTPKCLGDVPSRRSGHSFSIVGDLVYLFGGNDLRRPPGPNSDLYKLDMSSNEFYWTKVENTGRFPEPRSHHTTVVYGNKIILFGGFKSSSIRYNDVWILDTSNDEWSQPHMGITETKSDGEVVFKRNWPDVPSPRGAHTATLIGSQMYIFGGYGGAGFARRDFNDVTVLDLDTWEWRTVECTGEVPDARSGHQSVAVNDKIFMIGGWNSMLQFDNMYVLDTVTNAWSKPAQQNPFGPPRWNFSAVSVNAVPHWKVFVFGGNSGDLNDGGNPQGDYLNDMLVLETGTNTWTRPTVLGTVPSERGETQIVYDAKGSRIVVFGGWANRWFGDLHVCKVGDVVGPPYSVTSITPNMGPITGSTRCTISGVGFKSSGSQATIRFACLKGSLEVPGEVVSDSSINFDTPSFEKYGPLNVEGRVGVGGKSLTNTVVHFNYFSVTSCDATICFGPGVINRCIAANPVSFVIQARDASGANRTCGMDEYEVALFAPVVRKGVETFEPVEGHAFEVVDQKDGTYMVNFEYPSKGTFELAVTFKGTFLGKAGQVRGSPFRVAVLEEGDALNNELNGPLIMEHIRRQIKETKDYSTASLKSLKKAIPKEEVEALIRVKEVLKDVEARKKEVELSTDSCKAFLLYFKNKGGPMEKMIEQVDNAASLWADVSKQVPATTVSIVPLVKNWSGIIEEQIEAYSKEMAQKLKDFKLRTFWNDTVTVTEARISMNEAAKFLKAEQDQLATKTQLCQTFDFPHLVKAATECVDEMSADLAESQRMWDVSESLQRFVTESKEILWSEMDANEMDESAKNQVKAVKNLSKAVRWCSAYKAADKLSKDFLNTIPLVSLLAAKCMRERHWNALKVVTKKEFVPPYADKELLLGGILALNLHEFTADVEEICDQAAKELKIETTVAQLKDRWQGIEWLMEPYKDTDVPLLKMSEEDFESLEADQLTVQGMLASRFVKQFVEEVQEWQKHLANVADAFLLIGEIQRTWSYLEPLFIGSEEVKRELPEDAKRFEGIDVNVKHELKTAWEIRNVDASCNQDGLLARFEDIQAQLEICKKSLSDFLDGRRRQFPRYYFTSEADLLDILSNGSTPEKVLKHTAKVYLSCKTLTLDKAERTSEDRPYATGWVSGVGTENVEFEPRVPLNGKVEIYQQTILDSMKQTLFNNLTRSVVRYSEMPRDEWLMHKKPAPNPQDDSSDPAQIILITLAIYYVEEVEQAFRDMANPAKPNPQAMKEYSEKQVEQLKGLIRLTQTKLNKSDRTRVMVCITMDAHSRDIVIGMIRDNVSEASAFQWQSQLKHKYRKPPANASFVNRDLHLRGKEGQRAEIAIADAILPYDYEYLGNGPRLVITPLTDRIYVTATQALNLKMGCAPAGPAGTGKTESTKDLASALAKCCYVFNCSPEMDYLGLGNIFKGLASSGSWGCFDEFNRLVPEVLSVCTVQFKSVCDGVKAESARIVIESDEISLDPTCGAFITMNPGYLGRSELPEGLKALFRPITVMVPDLVLICENMLMAEGFTQAKILASKFYGLYSLLRDLLSKQMHYDWGLRAVKSVLVVAGGFKRLEPDLQEEALLMRALRDFNTPKIVREDEVVFFGLLGDLFPGIDPPRKVNPQLEEYVQLACESLGNHPDELFRLKVVQLEELLEIRHCVFVMGPPGAGKSQCWKTLAEARTLRGDKTKTVDINPKSVKTEELYGFISMATREWKDGLLSKVMRDLGEIPDEKPKWIILDGDLDANWIESMNSVMDDNKMLTLASNERIPLKPHMRLIFEIRDLRFATPATVSRAGILYISTDDGTQWQSLIQSWLLKLEADEPVKTKLQTCFSTYVKPTLRWMIKTVAPVVSLQDMNFVQTLLFMLDGTLTAQILGSEAADAIEKAFVFAMIWSMGSALTVTDDGTDNRKLFSDWWRSEWRQVKLPTQYTVFDYWYDPTSNTFELWSKSPFLSADMMEYDSATPMASVTVPTPETCSVTFWMRMLVGMRRPVMLAGPSGTGKTQIVNGMLAQFDPAEMLSCSINFNFYTTSAVLQNTMGIPLVKKTGTNFGPPGQAKLVYFVDDINLPEVDAYDTQSAIALLRQHLEYEHVYDLSKLTAKNIGSTQLIGCMNPTAGSFEINPRLQRWFATFAIGLPETMSLHTIYLTFLTGHLKKFDEEVQSIARDLVRCAVSLHREIMLNFRKTAQNFHYEFNIRHISNVFQGLLVSAPSQFKSPEKFVHLWLHESERVYGDRLVSYEDLTRYNTIVQAQHKKVFPGMNVARFYSTENADPLVFCHFSENIQDKAYDMARSMNKLSAVLEDALREYNETNATMDLVLFEDAMKHIARIVRVVMNSGGHALLVGVGGSGKQSLSRLSAFICGFKVVQIVISSTYGINDLKEDLKGMYMKAGLKEEGIMFLLTDSQITNERFLVFINDLLASGNIPDLFAVDEVDSIVNAVTNKVKATGLVPDRSNCWEFFINEIRKNLHVVLAFSPVGDAFRTRARKFPAIVNCTVIDWFQPWPFDALYSVGKKFMSNVDLGSQPAVRDVVESFLPYSFTQVNDMATKFRNVERRHVYTTPKSFLELLKLFSTLLATKRNEANEAIDRLAKGLQKLRETAEAVTQIEADLKVSLEEADQKRSVAEGIAEVVSKEKAIVEVETAKAQVQAKEVAVIQSDVMEKQRSTEEDLAKAEPMVEAAMAALNTLDRKDLGEAKTMAKPPAGVDDVFAATMVLLANVHPNVVVQKNGKVKDKSWDACKKQLLGSIPEYIEYLKGIKTGVDERTIPKINFVEVKQLTELEHFTYEAILTKNKAAAGLCSFVNNIVLYYDVVVTVEPKRKALAEANEQLESANSQLKSVMEMVADLESKLATLTSELNAANTEKQEALDTVERGQKKLDLAQRLTNALASENVRWAENIVTMEADKELLTGDVLLASAFISYVGPFTKFFRDKLMAQIFTPYLQENFQKALGEGASIPLSANADPLRILISPAEIATWRADGLPADQVSTENGAIVLNSARWPLIIDPQLQGIKWLRQKESLPERNLQVVRLGQSDLLRKLERALENGHSILIENIGESIDAVLNPVIQRAVIKRGKKMYIKLGDTEVDLHKDFRLFLHTKLSNPHYPPEVQAETTLINFTVTAAGLEDQLLSLVVRKERLDLALLSEDLVKQQNDFTIKMKELEDNILNKLAVAQGDITEDVDLIEGLETTKKIANEIAVKQVQATETQRVIKMTSEKYRGVANRSSLLFFLMNDLVKMHTYYIYSLEAFTTVFYRGIDMVPNVVLEPAAPADGAEGAPPSDEPREATDAELAVRCDVLIDSITRTVFNYIRRGLFEMDKLTVGTILTLRIAVNDNKLQPDEVEYLIEGKVSPDPGNMGPLHEWLPPAIWPRIKALETLKRYAGLGDNMQSDSDEWQKWFDSEMPEVAKFPGDYQKLLSNFDRLILLRAMRPDRVTTALRSWIEEMMGKEYVFQRPFDMAATFLETSNQTPTFFVLFAGVDPTPWVEGLGKERGITFENGNFKNISMGQGQEKPAEAVVENFAKNGGWVMLQNCHLMQSWVPKLERLLEVVQENAHPDFRCFISAEPPPIASWKNMPESLMQGSVKVANEAPSDIKSNITRGWANFTHDRVEACTKKDEFKACLFALCWFHSIVLGRRRFGQQGWSRKYSFNTGDLTICANVLQAYLEANPVVPWDDIRYIFGEIMYGGHITDAWDRRTCNSYLSVLVNDQLFNNLELGPGFRSPDPTTLDYEGYLTYVDDKLPSDSPTMFGLHPNAEIGYLTNWTASIFETILSLGGGGGGGGAGGSSTAATKESMEYLAKTLPENFQLITIMERAEPLLVQESGPFVVVCIQECQRMNGLLTEIRRSLVELDKGMKGQLNMSQPMEDLIHAISINQWPGRNPFSQCRWESKAWPSMKNLISQFADMVLRIEQLTAWCEELVTPFSVWLPGLFNPTSYLTAVMQVTARRTGMPLDQMTTETHVTTFLQPEQCDYYPEDGAFVHGFYIEGARWPTGDEAGDPEMLTGTPIAGHLVDGRLKELLPTMPVIYVKAVAVQPSWEPSAVGYLRRVPDIYECPVYITSFRGHTYVFLATLRTVDPCSKWVLTEKPSVARELTRIIAGVPHDSIRRQGYSHSNPVFDIEHCKFKGQPAKMKMTSVLGHLMELEFDPAYKGWGSCMPVDLFTAPIAKDVKGDFLNIKRTLVEEARKCNVLMLWLDCDLEGENIAYEVIKVCLEANPRLDVYRARFSALIDRDIMRTMQYPERPNPHMNDAVDARQEIDLRIGAAFTRFQTLRLQKKFENVGNAVISYGPCQFPTLGFVVDRDLRIKAFQPDNFWYLSCEVEFANPDKDDGSKLSCTFHWDRTRVYDKFACAVLFEACVEDIDRHPAVVTHSNERPTSKIRPLPLNTIELQKRASRFLKISSERTMLVAEALYQRGILSYPRTETDFFKEGFELLPLLQEHRGHPQWGAFATALVDNNGFEPPRRGQKDDQAHPPIHPTKCVDPRQLESDEERRVYDLVVRHFLACCSRDARGSQTKLSICLPEQGGESFSATGLMVLERNWLEVYTHEYWGASKVPRLQVGDAVVPKRLTMAEGRTSPPEPLTESDLITAMDQHGIGTDATIATHIATIQAREYVFKDAQSRFVPTKLGLALVEGYNSMGYQLNKPQLRAAIEADVQRIARGELNKAEAVRKCLDTMRTCFVTCNREAARLDEAMGRYFSGLGVGGDQGGEAPAVLYDTLARNLSTCGACRGGMDLRVERGANRESAPRFLYCASCRQAHVVPGKGELTPHAVSCVICGFQALTVRNKDSGKEHTVCPKCFADPPPPPDGIEGAADFRCFSCARENCELSGRIPGSDVDVAPCIEPRCGGKMRVRRVGPKSGGSYMLACSSSAAGGGCKAVWWMPKFVKTAVPQAGSPCPRCLERHGVAVARILFNFLLSKAPPVGLEPECVLCPSCDGLWRQVDAQPLPILARPGGNGRQQPPPPQPHRQQQQQQAQMQPQSQPLPQQPRYHAQQPQRAQPYQQPPPAQHWPPSAPAASAQPYVLAQSAVAATYPAQNRPPGAYSEPPSSSASVAAPGVAPAPNCQCSLPCKLLTTTKAGDNHGRMFYSCPSGRDSGCNHFQWADEPPRPALGGGFAGSRGGHGGNRSAAESAQRPGPECQCGAPSALCTVSKEGENKGRRFFGCRSRACKFFQWEDELTTGGKTAAAVQPSKPWTKRDGDTQSKPFTKRGGASNADTSNITCSHCKKRGHGSRFCPEKM